MSEEMITITKERYEDLLRAELELACLEEMGVDNWEGFSDAMRLYRDRHGK